MFDLGAIPPSMLRDKKAYRPVRGACWFVTELPGQDGKDWGYGDAKDAIPLTPYWQRRFAADCRRVGTQAIFLE